MKKISAIGLLLILFAFASQAQSVYSKQNLEQASQENLNLYLQKAQALYQTGAVITIIGTAATASGVILMGFINGEGAAYTGFYIALVGLPITLIGLPILFTGSSRVKRINGIMNTISDEAFIEIEPCSFQNQLARNYQPGLTLRLRF